MSYSLSILVSSQVINRQEYNDYLSHIHEKYPDIQLSIFLPSPPRKHYTVMFVGEWIRVQLVKCETIKWIEKESSSDYEEFDKMIFNQQVRYNYKSIKRYIIENHHNYIKNWDFNYPEITFDDRAQFHDKMSDREKAVYKYKYERKEGLAYFCR